MFTDYLENKLIDFALRGQPFSPPASTYAALFTELPTDTGGGTEVVGASYARVEIPSSLASWAGTQGAGTTDVSSGTSATTSNNNVLAFPDPQENWGQIVGVGLYDALTGGNLLYYGELAVPKTVNQGDSAPTFAAGTLELQFDDAA